MNKLIILILLLFTIAFPHVSYAQMMISKDITMMKMVSEQREKDRGQKESNAQEMEFLGAWKVADGEGEIFYINLLPYGKAASTWGEGEQGKWKIMDGKAFVEWNNGWQDVLEKEDEGYKKTAFAPGTSLDDKPDNTSEATKVKIVL